LTKNLKLARRIYAAGNRWLEKNGNKYTDEMYFFRDCEKYLRERFGDHVMVSFSQNLSWVRYYIGKDTSCGRPPLWRWFIDRVQWRNKLGENVSFDFQDLHSLAMHRKKQPYLPLEDILLYIPGLDHYETRWLYAGINDLTASSTRVRYRHFLSSELARELDRFGQEFSDLLRKLLEQAGLDVDNTIICYDAGDT